LALSRFTEGRALRGGDDTRELALVPVEPRPPVDEVRPDPSLFIPPVTQAPVEVEPVSQIPPPVVQVPPVVETPPVVQAPPVTPPAVVTPPPIQPPVTASRSAFSAPTIRSLQAGQYYLQIAAYSNAASVNPEIARLDNRLPVAVMDAGTPQSPLYRILIGPLTLGEAGAMLHRFRNTHSDAFVRLGE
jgi:septal ring-binding cell division protein DamX